MTANSLRLNNGIAGQSFGFGYVIQPFLNIKKWNDKAVHLGCVYFVFFLKNCRRVSLREIIELY